MTPGTVLLIILVILIIGAAPAWPYATWGVAPSGLLGVLLVIVLALALTGRI